jgi:hypothetical protein
MMTKDYFVSDARYVELDFKIDHECMLNEAIALKEHFVIHREGSYDHKGWKSLVLHGWNNEQSGHWKDYGYKDIDSVIKDLHWTELSNRCPKTVDFVKNHFPSNIFGRVRFMLLEAGGYIAEHADSRVPLLDNTNISLSNPRDCLWRWGDGETLYMIPGKTYVMNIHYSHSVYNNSDEDRYHLIIHRLDSIPEWKKLLDDACSKQGITGTYCEHEVLT